MSHGKYNDPGITLQTMRISLFRVLTVSPPIYLIAAHARLAVGTLQIALIPIVCH